MSEEQVEYVKNSLEEIDGWLSFPFGENIDRTIKKVKEMRNEVKKWLKKK